MSMSDKNIREAMFGRTSSCLSLDDIFLYIFDKLDPDRKHAIEAHLVQCPLCSDAMEGAREYMIHWETDASIETPGIKTYKRPGKRAHWPKYRRIYAVAALIILAAGLHQIYYKHPSHEALFRQYFRPYVNTVIILRNNAEPEPLQMAMAAYAAEDYESALNQLEDILSDSCADYRVYLYAAISALMLDKNQKAIDRLDSALQLKPGAERDVILWHLGLARLRAGNTEKAVRRFSELSQKPGEYQNRSREILRRVKL